jgi:two-component system, OmpR family, sensor kinase
MSRIPVRLRLTVAFAVAMVAVLVAAAAFVYQRLEADLDETIDEALVLRADSGAAAAPAEAEEGFVQVYASDGRLLESSGGARGPVLDAAEVDRGARAAFFAEREVEGVAATTRMYVSARGPRQVVAVGQSLEDRDETLSGLVTSFAIGGPIAVVLASLLGYGLARAGLTPIEAMRRRARSLSLERTDELLPVGSARDEVRRLGETLNEMLARMRASYERERNFVADASHELRTPIAVVRAELEAALASGEIGGAAREGLVEALAECDRLGHLAEDLLVLARATEDGVPVARRQVDATSLLESLAIRFRARAAASGRSIAVDAQPGLELSADELRVRQALGNLIDNALRHGDGDVRLSARTRGDAVEFEVADSGAGFSPGFEARAFERFSRARSNRDEGGAGLGLALVRAIAEAHGGDARIADAGPGASVRISLPRA